MLNNYSLAILLYSLSALLDAFDGLAARLFNQSSVFGSILDMLTDRVSTVGILMTLGHLYVDYFFVFQMLLIIDIVSHWVHFFSASLQGKVSHKISDSQTNPLMRLYYENKLVLTSICALEQIFYCSMLVYYHERNNGNLTTFLMWPIVIGAPAILFKNYINLLQTIGACRSLGAIDSRRASFHGQ
jgi:CDP-diacylglycerol--inositol 3-phosphatidyltransferase